MSNGLIWRAKNASTQRTIAICLPLIRRARGVIFLLGKRQLDFFIRRVRGVFQNQKGRKFCSQFRG
jgi:hypothetical protein